MGSTTGCALHTRTEKKLQVTPYSSTISKERHKQEISHKGENKSKKFQEVHRVEHNWSQQRKSYKKMFEER